MGEDVVLEDSAVGRGSAAIGPSVESAAAVAVSAAVAGIDAADLRRRKDIDRGCGLDGSAPCTCGGSGCGASLLGLAASGNAAAVAVAGKGTDMAALGGGTESPGCSSATRLGTTVLRAMRNANAFLGLPPPLPPAPFSAIETRQWNTHLPPAKMK